MHKVSQISLGLRKALGYKYTALVKIIKKNYCFNDNS